MKVLCVGCSFTFGDELARPAESAWPAVLARVNNWTVVNRGVGGASNDRIIRTVFEEINNGYDLIIVAWTHTDRFEVPMGSINIDINASSIKRRGLTWAEDYYKLHHNKEYTYAKWFRNTIMMQSYLKQRNQRYIFCSTFGIESDLQKEYESYVTKFAGLIDQVDSTYYVDWPKLGILDWQGDCPKGPGGHPLELGHERIAEKINEHIRHLGWLS
jgi:lysophospholipase L1-like esterase